MKITVCDNGEQFSNVNTQVSAYEKLFIHYSKHIQSIMCITACLVK